MGDEGRKGEGLMYKGDGFGWLEFVLMCYLLDILESEDSDDVVLMPSLEE